MPTPERLQRMRQVLLRRQDDLDVVLENIHDAHNASAILRTCDGLGVGAAHLLYTDEVFPEISNGVAGHAAKWLTLRRHADPAACVAALHAHGRKVYATAMEPGTVDYLDVDWTQPSAVVFGNESRGCSADLVALADARIAIPMQGMVQSFNVSVAAGIILAEAFRQRWRCGRYSRTWSAELQTRLEAWIARDAPWQAGDPTPGPD